jgi:threonine/homoserine/homoserine lactone efflux protein
VAGFLDYWLFVLSAVLLNIAPGQDTLYILGRSIGQGRRVGIASALGVSAGTVVHTFAAALGLSAIVAASATAFLVIKLLGAAYLVYLGVRAIVAPSTVLSLDTARTGDARAAFRQGLVTNELNPKVGLFFLAFLPQFVAADAALETFGVLLQRLTFVATGTVWVLVLALAAASVRRIFERRRAEQAWLSRAMGGAFVYLGVRLALSER